MGGACLHPRLVAINTSNPRQPRHSAIKTHKPGRHSPINQACRSTRRLFSHRKTNRTTDLFVSFLHALLAIDHSAHNPSSGRHTICAGRPCAVVCLCVRPSHETPHQQATSLHTRILVGTPPPSLRQRYHIAPSQTRNRAGVPSLVLPRTICSLADRSCLPHSGSC